MPESLQGLVSQEEDNEGVGFHVTLYEFLHHSGHHYQGLVNLLLTGEYGFFHKLKYNITYLLPTLSVVARQTRMTSLQVMVDIYTNEIELSEANRNFLQQANWSWDEPGVRRIVTEYCSHPMDLVSQCCRNAQKQIDNNQDREAFNMMAVPFPLHMTLLRFPPNMELSLKQQAEAWSRQYNRRIWGRSENLSLILVGANKCPYFGLNKVVVK